MGCRVVRHHQASKFLFPVFLILTHHFAQHAINRSNNSLSRSVWLRLKWSGSCFAYLKNVTHTSITTVAFKFFPWSLWSCSGAPCRGIYSCASLSTRPAAVPSLIGNNSKYLVKLSITTKAYLFLSLETGYYSTKSIVTSPGGLVVIIGWSGALRFSTESRGKSPLISQEAVS